jgi:hypothetical protein
LRLGDLRVQCANCFGEFSPPSIGEGSQESQLSEGLLALHLGAVAYFGFTTAPPQGTLSFRGSYIVNPKS